MIDHDALGELQDWSHGWRSAIAYKDQLGEIYVPGEGDNPSVMIVGEAPGAQEEIRRRPFVGNSGLILRELMRIAGLSLENSWITNVVKFRPPGNRTPTNQEIELGSVGLNMEWRAIGKPRNIVLVGNVALQSMFHEKLSIMHHSGQRHVRTLKNGTQYYIWPMIHPSYVLRSNSKQLKNIVEQEWTRLGRWVHDHNHG